MVLMAVHVSLDALGKYLLSLPIPATLEVVAFYYMPAVAALPIAHVELKGGHVALEMVFEAFPRWLQRMVLLLNGLLMIAFIGLLTFLAGREALRKFEVGEYMFGEYPLIIWPGRFIFTFGLAFFCFVVLVKTLDIAVGASVGRARAQEDRA
jgi:TRAP-type mannitol/chloroaromatic compound transport system permease small subunit